MKKIDPEKFIKFLKKKKIENFFGVPDSLLKDFVNNIKENCNIVCANEGLAVSTAIGNYLATKSIPCVYMQNSGLGNAINPLISIAHKSVYSIPLLLIVGWRGHDGKSDEPQHNSQGKVTRDMLRLLNIKNIIFNTEKNYKNLKDLLIFSSKNKTPVAILVKPNIFEKKNIKTFQNNYKVKRSDFINTFLNLVPKNARIFSSTGFNSRELFQLRKQKNNFNGKDFYLVGGMGHTLSLSLGYSFSAKKKTFCIDGDGSFLMHLGSMITFANKNQSNLKYILLNNKCHESVGSQKTHSEQINFRKISQVFKFKKFLIIKNPKDLNTVTKKFITYKESCFLLVNIKNKSLMNLGRPKNLISIKKKFIQ